MAQRVRSRGQRRSREYHHGDLKVALVEHATRILRSGGVSALTLRAVARAAGVSPAAPYRHFRNRRELVAAIAENGFDRLQQAMMVALGSGGRSGLRDVAAAYVRFGLENPAVYRVMFGPEVAHTEDLPSLRTTARGVLDFVAGGIVRLQDAGLVGKGDAHLIAVATWATLHGVVTLTLDGQTETVAPSVDAVVDEATRLLMFGMARPASP